MTDSSQKTPMSRDLMSLPHPARARIGNVLEAFHRMLGDSAWRRLFELSKLPMDEIFTDLQYDQQWNNMLRSSTFSSHPGTFNYGMVDTFLPVIKLNATGATSFQTDDRLEILLEHTDIGDDTPARYLKLPYQSMFLEFGESRCSTLQLFNPVSGHHILEGTYLFEYELPPGTRMIFNNARRNSVLGIDATLSVRLLEIVFIGSPVGKENILDDCIRQIQLFVQDDDLTVEQILERHFEWYAILQSSTPGLTPFRDEDRIAFHDSVTHLAKILLYLHTSPRLEHQNERSDIERQMRSRGPKKQGKLLRKLDKAYDRIVIRSTHDAAIADTSVSHTEGRKVTTHWRRGHFRNQAFGAGRLERRLIWIAPILVSGVQIGVAAPKPYKLR